MLASLFLQLTALLGPAPELGVGPDPVYAQKIQDAASLPGMNQEALQALRPQDLAQEAALIHLLRHGSAARVRLAAILAAGREGSHPLSAAALQAACQVQDTGAALAALLAPRSVRPEDLPALAYLALDSSKALELRAAAIGRLLENDCPNAWPMARSILRTGTSLDEDAPWADWRRSGRYELPKRLLLISVDAWFQNHDLAAAAYEPNASWARQAEQLKELEPKVQQARSRSRWLDSTLQRSAHHRGCDLLLQWAQQGDLRAQRALSFLYPLGRNELELALRQGSADARRAAQRIIEILPQ
ncbi:MAG: hypothetical protein DWQ01_07755 [Planctomycetota bacterium]|nr:MAG: hypothetical protein DWQ01_07755 [Planctomycetota bacterium]